MLVLIPPQSDGRYLQYLFGKTDLTCAVLIEVAKICSGLLLVGNIPPAEGAEVNKVQSITDSN